MIHAIVGGIAAGCVVSGFVIGFSLIIQGIIKDIRKNKKDF
jgi:pantothenate kinase type III